LTVLEFLSRLFNLSLYSRVNGFGIEQFSFYSGNVDWIHVLPQPL